MSFIDNIKTGIGKRMLQKEVAGIQRNRGLFNLATSKTAGILYEASNGEDYELIKKYVGYLKEYGIKVKTIGYFSKKEIPQFTFSKLDYEFFTKKELSWYCKPLTSFTDQFVQQEFDLLIDLNIYAHFPLKYLASISKAKFKIGRLNEDNKITHDMMIEIDSEKNLKYFLRQVDIYLQMINKKEDTPKNQS
jgi:hypothetical protein